MVSGGIHRKGSGLKVCYIGCSFTYGDEIPEQDVWCNRLDKYFDCDSVNIASNGNSNHNIFTQALHSRQQDYDVIFVQWTRMYRITQFPKPETQCNIAPNSISKVTHSEYDDFIFSKSMKQQLLDLNIVTNNIYNLLKNILDYSLALQDLDDRFVFFNLGLDAEFNPDLNKGAPDDLYSLRSVTKDMLDFDHNSDEHIIFLLTQLQNKYKKIDFTRWLSIYPSIIETAHQQGDIIGTHPGKMSHERIFMKAKKYIQTSPLIVPFNTSHLC